MLKLSTIIITLLAIASFSRIANDDPVRPELGKVSWGRDFDVAQKSAADSNKPMLLLFQEVPG